MKTNYWLVLGAMLASSAIAQNNTNTLPEMPAPIASPAAAEMTPTATTPKAAPVKPMKRAATPVKVARLKEPTVALVPGPAEVTVSNLIVRGQAGLNGEQVAHLSKGDTVTVLNQINLGKHQAGEPAQWAKIALPSAVRVWVNAKFIDEASKVVSAKRLNLRAGPGENYSVLGVIEKGAPVNGLETKGDWIKIEAPTNTCAFVAAMYLKQEAPGPAVAAVAPPTEIAPAPAPTPVPEPQPIVTEHVNTPPGAVAAPEPIVVGANVPPPPRIATHEGVVRHVGSLIAPTTYELYDPGTGKNIDYLYPSTGTLDLSQYVNAQVIVTGEEGLDARWKDIPVLTVERVQVIKTNAVPHVIYRSPRQSQRY